MSHLHHLITDFSYQHTLDLTALIPYLRQSNAKSEKAAYRSPDFPVELQAQPAAASENKTTILSYLVKALLLALDEHPAMRGMIVDNGTEQWLEVRRDPVVSIAVSGTSPTSSHSLIDRPNTRSSDSTPSTPPIQYLSLIHHERTRSSPIITSIHALTCKRQYHNLIRWRSR